MHHLCVNHKSCTVVPAAEGSKTTKAKAAKARAGAGDAEKDRTVPKKDAAHSPRARDGAGFHSLDMFSHLPPHLKMTAQGAVKKSDVRVLSRISSLPLMMFTKANMHRVIFCLRPNNTTWSCRPHKLNTSFGEVLPTVVL